jgi:hypothetical protein
VLHRKRLEAATEKALRAVEHVRAAYITLASDVDITVEAVLQRNSDTTPLSELAKQLDFYKSRLDAVAETTPSEVRRDSHSADCSLPSKGSAETFACSEQCEAVAAIVCIYSSVALREATRVSRPFRDPIDPGCTSGATEASSRIAHRISLQRTGSIRLF